MYHTQLTILKAEVSRQLSVFLQEFNEYYFKKLVDNENLKPEEDLIVFMGFSKHGQECSRLLKEIEDFKKLHPETVK